MIAMSCHSLLNYNKIKALFQELLSFGFKETKMDLEDYKRSFLSLFIEAHIYQPKYWSFKL